MKTVLLNLVKAYQLFAEAFKWFLGGQAGCACRFRPTCSEYAKEALEGYGAMRGSWLTLKRLLRCHPLSGQMGYDPVPVKVKTEVKHHE